MSLHGPAASWRALVAVAVAVCLGGCQAVDTQGALQPEGLTPAPIAAVDEETLGRGAVPVALLLSRSGQGAADYRDGAALAMTDLGAEQITLSISDTKGQSDIASTKAKVLISKGAKLLIGPASEAELKSVAAARAKNAPPIMAFVDGAASRPPGVFTMRASEDDSAIAGFAYVRETGRRNVLAVAPPGVPAASLARLKRQIEEMDGTFLGSITFRNQQDLVGAATANVATADAVILFAGPSLAEIVAGLRSAGLPGSAQLIGTSSWTRIDHTNAALAGAVVPLPDQSGLRDASKRMQASFGRPMSMDAALAYDAVALAASIVRALGPDKLSTATLRQPTGFKGVTGSFRFNSDGSVNRLYSIYQAAPKGLSLLSEAAPGF